MPKFSKSSISKLNTCHPHLVNIFNEVIKERDCTVIYGARSDFDQQRLFKEGKTKLDGVNKRSKHQVDSINPMSRAVDVAPYPIDWNNKERFHELAKIVFNVAKKQNIKIRWGGDWDGDGDFTDQTFNDLPHFELI